MNEIALKDNKDIVYSSFVLQKNGITPIGEPTFEQWQECGEFIKKANGACHFWIGDWLNYGEQKYGEMYSQAIDETGYDYGTLRNDKSVASGIELSRRRDNLSYSHHVEVVGLEPEEQDELLNLAEKNEIKSKDFRQVVRDYKKKKERALLPPVDTNRFGKQVICGDCLIEMGKMADKSVDMIYVDPPYNMGKGEWDTFSDGDFLVFTEAWLKECMRLLKDKSHLFINFCSDKSAWLENLILEDFGILPASHLIWHYRNAGGKSSGKEMFSKTYEPILHYNFGNKELNFPTEWDDERFDVWVIAIPQSNFAEGHDHPTQKPVELLDRLVRFGSREGEIILDPMAGVGTTGVAALKNKRDFILIEKEATYVENIHQRLNELSNTTK